MFLTCLCGTATTKVALRCCFTARRNETAQLFPSRRHPGNSNKCALCCLLPLLLLLPSPCFAFQMPQYSHEYGKGELQQYSGIRQSQVQEEAGKGGSEVIVFPFDWIAFIVAPQNHQITCVALHIIHRALVMACGQTDVQQGLIGCP